MRTIGQWLSYSLLIAPVGLLAYAWLKRYVGATQPIPPSAQPRP